mgnify:CR=1 FL=1
MDRQMRPLVNRHLPMATTGRARAERAIANLCHAHRAGRVLRVLKCHANRDGRMRQQIATCVDHKFRESIEQATQQVDQITFAARAEIQMNRAVRD